MTRDRRVLLAIAAGNAVVIVCGRSRVRSVFRSAPLRALPKLCPFPMCSTIAEAAIVTLSIALAAIRRPLPVGRWTTGAAGVVASVVALGIAIAAIVGVQGGGGCPDTRIRVSVHRRGQRGREPLVR